jgi:hypothetical protein
MSDLPSAGDPELAERLAQRELRRQQRQRQVFVRRTVALAIAGIVAIGVAGGIALSSGGSSSKAAPKPVKPAKPVAKPDVILGAINPKVPGLTTFRGNLTRTYYGHGPVPKNPVVRWRYPESGGMCAQSSDEHGTETWCGTGWTGQPNVIPHKSGLLELRFGAYDDHYHFMNAITGKPIKPDLVTGDLAKGSATSDPDGYPLYYAGSRDNDFRIIATDRPTPTVLWSMNADTSVPYRHWNNDWDGAALVVGDYLLEGGENSWFFVIRLNRHYDAAGKVAVDPRIVMRVPGWDSQLLATVHDKDISIEDSVAYANGVAYFANGGGLVQGWDISDILRGGTHYQRVFRFWDGDDTDATPVILPNGDLIVGRKMEENVPRPESYPRDHQVGDLMELDPRRPGNPLVWSVQLGGFAPDNGVLGTPAYYRGVVYASYTDGGLAAVDAATGRLLWSVPIAPPTWSSPVPIDGKLLMADGHGNLNCFDISNPTARPRLLWSLHLSNSPIESTPAVWRGWIYVGSRDGGIYGISDPAR